MCILISFLVGFMLFFYDLSADENSNIDIGTI